MRDTFCYNLAILESLPFLIFSAFSKRGREPRVKNRVLTSFRGLVKFMNFLVKLHEVRRVSRTSLQVIWWSRDVKSQNFTSLRSWSDEVGDAWWGFREVKRNFKSRTSSRFVQVWVRGSGGVTEKNRRTEDLKKKIPIFDGRSWQLCSMPAALPRFCVAAYL